MDSAVLCLCFYVDDVVVVVVDDGVVEFIDPFWMMLGAWLRNALTRALKF